MLYPRNDITNGVAREKFSCVIPKGRDVECGNVTAVHSASSAIVITDARGAEHDYL